MFTAPAPVTQRRLEAGAVLIAAVVAYSQVGAGWPLFAALFFVPDLSIAVYLVGPRAGGVAYNLAHFYVWPLLLTGWVALGGAPPLALPIALVWAAHIAFDRVLGWGLKSEESFMHTDMGLQSLPISVPFLEPRPR